MKQPTFCGRELLPLSVIEAARAGDPLAVERVLWYYEGYMDKLCTRTLYDLDGSPRVRVDEYMKRRLQAPSGNQAHFFHRHNTVTNRPPEAETA